MREGERKCSGALSVHQLEASSAGLAAAGALRWTGCALPTTFERLLWPDREEAPACGAGFATEATGSVSAASSCSAEETAHTQTSYLHQSPLLTHPRHFRILQSSQEKHAFVFSSPYSLPFERH